MDHELNSMEIAEEIGGMGAGYAHLLDATLISCLPEKSCPIKNRIQYLIQANSISHQTILISNTETDWTLLVSSGRHGDKLPIGLRGCHDRLKTTSAIPPGPYADVVVVASLRNELMLKLLKQHSGAIRMLSPALRNCYPDSNTITLDEMAEYAEILAVNRFEWLAMGESARTAWESSGAIISVTDGPGGATVSWRGPGGKRECHYEPAFPRSIAPVDTNRAGEAFSGTLLSELTKMGWPGRGHSPSREMIEKATKIASVAAGLTIQISGFGFPGH
ncbi:MAG: carbohydrate kinase family protein, partial [bacterium]